ncbi:MAG: ribonuclease H-like domain-containing protein [Polyangiales bacterium]
MSISRKLDRLRSTLGPGGLAGKGTLVSDAPDEPEPLAPAQEARFVPDEPGPPADEDSRWDAFRAALRSKGEREARHRAARPVAEVPTVELPGAIEETPLGRLHRIAQSFAGGHRHGDVPIGSARSLDPSIVARFGLDERLGEVDPSRFVFLDTETTGLAGGTGTIPFLVGMAWFEGESLRVEQLFLRGFGEEAPILERVRSLLAEASALVTFNGKSFDWPLLRTRFVMNRMPVPEPAIHLDLVHGARRLLRQRLESVRLVEVERAVLGHVREGDVDGSQIPAIYLEWLRRGHHPDMGRVIEHNALDLLAMPAMLGRLGARLADADETATAEDRLACARIGVKARDDELVRRFASRVAEESEGRTAAEALVLTARLARRSGDVEAEERSLLRALSEAEDEAATAAIHLALSKHYEHRANDPAKALAHARKTAAAEGDEACGRRVARLAKKAGLFAD